MATLAHAMGDREDRQLRYPKTLVNSATAGRASASVSATTPSRCWTTPTATRPSPINGVHNDRLPGAVARPPPTATSLYQHKGDADPRPGQAGRQRRHGRDETDREVLRATIWPTAASRPPRPAPSASARATTTAMPGWPGSRRRSRPSCGWGRGTTGRSSTATATRSTGPAAGQDVAALHGRLSQAPQDEIAAGHPGDRHGREESRCRGHPAADVQPDHARLHATRHA